MDWRAWWSIVAAVAVGNLVSFVVAAVLLELFSRFLSCG